MRNQIPNQSIYKLTYICFFFPLQWERPCPSQRQYTHLCSVSDRGPPPPPSLTLLSLPPFYQAVLKKLTSPFITHYLSSILSFLHSHSLKKKKVCAVVWHLLPYSHSLLTSQPLPLQLLPSDPSAMHSMGILSPCFTWPVATTIIDTLFPCSK